MEKEKEKAKKKAEKQAQVVSTGSVVFVNFIKLKLQ